jgi:AraC family transcriptional regulator
MTIYVKNMVCARCIRSVTDILTQAGLAVIDVRLGEADVDRQPTTAELALIKGSLHSAGFEWLDDRNSRMIAQIKSLIIDEIHHAAARKKTSDNYSTFLSRQTGHEYSHLSKLFSSVEGMTIEKFIISQKIERVKELLIYDERSLAEIADELEYSSSQHLSTQFKQALGMTPTEFKRTHTAHRKSLDAI